MNKMMGLLVATAMVISVGHYALSSNAPNLPPGTSADTWVALGDRLGFVVTNGDSSLGSVSSVGVAKGYFMLRRGGIWLRIDSTQGDGEVGPGR